jgi:DNA-binding transcriptional regulator/RsmH inhibitor MraZ
VTVTDLNATYRLRLDGKRRPTLPASLLDDAGIDPAHELVARTDGHGRVVLEDPLVMLAAFQDAVAADKRTHGIVGSLVDDLLADRAADPSARS